MPNLLLGISIPTYKRRDYFKRQVLQLSEEISTLSQSWQKLVAIKIYENPSEYTDEKRQIVESAKFGCSKIDFNVNLSNIGGDSNIEQAFSSFSESSFTWVLGDDEQILNGALRNIVNYLEGHPNCGLLLLRDTTYRLKSEVLSRQTWANYSQFASDVLAIQSHLIIGHTLISSNIFASAVFNRKASTTERLVTAPRAGLPFSFAHMVGLLSGLSKRDDLSVDLLLIPAIDTSDRAPSSFPAAAQPIDTWSMMQRLYRHHLYFVGYQFGLDVARVFSHPSMTQILGEDFCRPEFSGIARFSRIQSRLRHYLRRLFSI